MKLQSRPLHALALSCLAVVTACTPEPESVAPARKLVTSTDGRVSLSVPADWHTDRVVHPDARLQVTAPDESLMVVVLSERKDDGNPAGGLPAYAGSCRDALIERAEGGSVVGEPRFIEVNGLETVQYEIRTAVNGRAVTYLLVVVDGEESFYQVAGWTDTASFPRLRSALEDVLWSFLEMPADSTFSSPSSQGSDG